jgi:hypothetical protein
MIASVNAKHLAAYQESPNTVKILLVDDAPQFKGITELLALCWIHEGRHYKKLTSYLYLHQQEVDNFLDKFWEYYKRLLAYKRSPDAKQAKALSDEFDVLFAIRTGYDALDKRIAMTKAKKECLLLVLKHPKIPALGKSKIMADPFIAFLPMGLIGSDSCFLINLLLAYLPNPKKYACFSLLHLSHTSQQPCH